MIRCGSVRNRFVAPHRGPNIVGPDAGNQIRNIDVVLRLGDIVEARIVHDRWCVTHLVHPVTIPNLVLWIHRTSLHVVLKTERVANFVRHDEFKQTSHQIIGQRELLSTRIERACLQEIPRPLQVHDVVIELNVGFEDLSSARIVNVRATGILDRRRQPANHRVARVLWTEVRILLWCRRELGNDRILEPGGFKCLLPTLYTFL